MPALSAPFERKLALLLVGIGLAIRAVLMLSYEPILFEDSPAYFGLARAIQTLDFSFHTGVRTPGYPLLVLLGQGSLRAIWVLQSMLGILGSWIVFRLGLSHTRDAVVSFVLALSVSLSLNLLFFEAAIMTEALSTFLIVLLAWLFQRLDRDPSRASPSHLLLGLVLGLATLTRPGLLMLTPVYASFVCLRGNWRDRFRKAAAVVLPMLLLVGGWSLVNKKYCDYFGPSVLTGYNLTQHCGLYIEHADEQFAALRDVFLKHRARSEAHNMVIWAAAPELEAIAGSRAQLTRQLSKMSIDLFLRYPDLYLRSVAEALFKFWTPENYWMYTDTISPGPESWTFSFVSNPGLRGFLETLPLTVGWMLRIFFLVAVVANFVPRFRSERVENHASLDAMILGLLVSSVFQALVTNGDNWRYYVPFQPVLHITVFVWAWTMLAKQATSTTAAPRRLKPGA